jgi:outer membrane protein assembly factor BamB
VVDENAIYIASSNGRIYSLDKEYGDLNWKSVVLGEKLWTPPVIEGDTIYVSTFDGYIYTLPAKGASPTKDVEPSWAFKADVGFVSSPAIGEETDIIFAGSFDNNLYAIKIGSSEPLRSFPGSKWFWGTPIINEGILYAGCLDGKIYAIDADSGKEVWKEPFDAESPIVASPLLVDGSLVVAAESGNVYVINSKTGTGERIKNPGNDNRPSIDTRIWASLCANEGVVYVRGQDNCLYALDIEKGWISWKLSL